MDEQRKLLDQLMGKHRNADASVKVKERHFSDNDVCKFHLAGLCPYSLFQNTRSDLGFHPDDIEDDETCKEEWDKLNEREKIKYGYEKQLMLFLRKLVQRCDERVERQKSRQIDAMITEGDVERAMLMEKQIKDLTASAEQLAEEGEIEQAQALMSQVERLKQAKEKIAAGPQGEKRMIVCEVSGNLMSNTDNEERIQAHFTGKMYIGWKKVRETLKQLEELDQKRRGVTRTRSRSRSPDLEFPNQRGGADDRNESRRSRERKSSKRSERSRERDRSRDRSGSRDKDRKKYKKHDKSRSRERESRGRNSGRGSQSHDSYGYGYYNDS